MHLCSFGVRLSFDYGNLLATICWMDKKSNVRFEDSTELLIIETAVSRFAMYVFVHTQKTKLISYYSGYK